MRKVLWIEALGFLSAVAMLWANEVFDLPSRLTGTAETPFNWCEALLETGFLLVLGAAVVGISGRLLSRIRRLEGLLPICSGCKSIRQGEEWVPLEEYLTVRTGAEFTHGLCPECRERLYGR